MSQFEIIIATERQDEADRLIASYGHRGAITYALEAEENALDNDHVREADYWAEVRRVIQCLEEA